MSVASSSDSRGTSQNSVDMFISLLLILVDVSSDISWVALWIERTHGSNESTHHSHRMSIMSEILDESFESMMVI